MISFSKGLVLKNALKYFERSIKLSEVVAPDNKPGRVESTIFPPFVNFVQPRFVMFMPKTKNSLCLFCSCSTVPQSLISDSFYI